MAGIGNASKNNPKARAPWFLNENVSLAKNVNLTEKVKLTIRGEAFNVLNRVRWGSPDSTLTSSTFGQVRSQGNSPRQMQLAAKIVF